MSRRSGISPRVLNVFFFFFNCVLTVLSLNWLILMFPVLILSKVKIIAAFFSTYIELLSKYRQSPAYWLFYFCSLLTSFRRSSHRRHQRHSAKAPLQYDGIIPGRVAFSASMKCRHFNDCMPTTFSNALTLHAPRWTQYNTKNALILSLTYEYFSIWIRTTTGNMHAVIRLVDTCTFWHLKIKY